MEIINIDGVGVKYRSGLNKMGIHSLDEFSHFCQLSENKVKICKELGIRINVVEQWKKSADLLRIKGVSTRYANLFRQVGVDSVEDLSHRNPRRLYKKIIKLNKSKEIVKRVPPIKTVTKLIWQAKSISDATRTLAE